MPDHLADGQVQVRFQAEVRCEGGDEPGDALDGPGEVLHSGRVCERAEETADGPSRLAPRRRQEVGKAAEDAGEALSRTGKELTICKLFYRCRSNNFFALLLAEMKQANKICDLLYTSAVPLFSSARALSRGIFPYEKCRVVGSCLLVAMKPLYKPSPH